MRRSGFVAALLVATVVAGLAAVTWIGIQTGEDGLIAGGPFSIGVAFFTFVGAVIVWRQPANRIGWLFSAVGVLWVTGDLAGRYPAYAHATGGGDDLLSFLGAWYGEWYWFVFLMLTFSLVPQLFPNGEPLPGRWKTFAKGVLLFTVLMGTLTMFEDDLVVIGTGRSIDNPFGIPGFSDIEEGPTALLVLPGGLICITGGLVSIVARFRRSRGEERLQLKWFTVAVALLIVEFVVQSFLGDDSGHRYPLLDGLALAFVPVSAAIAILRYRLYDIDVVINRALVYGSLTAILAAAYLGIVVLLQGALSPLTADSDVAVAGSTLAVAGLFRPVRARVQEFIDRRFYRHKYDAAETLEEFATSLRDEVDLDSLSHELVSVVGTTMQPAHASLWLRGGEA